MRWSISFFESPATRISLKTLSLPVDGTCGPRHRSTQSPCPYSEIASFSGIEAMISAL